MSKIHCVLFLACFLMLGCQKRMSGEYRLDSGPSDGLIARLVYIYDFRSDGSVRKKGTVTFSANLGGETKNMEDVAGTYTISGNTVTVKIKGDEAPILFTKETNGDLIFGSLRLKKLD